MPKLTAYEGFVKNVCCTMSQANQKFFAAPLSFEEFLQCSVLTKFAVGKKTEN